MCTHSWMGQQSQIWWCINKVLLLLFCCWYYYIYLWKIKNIGTTTAVLGLGLVEILSWMIRCIWILIFTGSFISSTFLLTWLSLQHSTWPSQPWLADLLYKHVHFQCPSVVLISYIVLPCHSLLCSFLILPFLVIPCCAHFLYCPSLSLPVVLISYIALPCHSLLCSFLILSFLVIPCCAHFLYCPSLSLPVC